MLRKILIEQYGKEIAKKSLKGARKIYKEMLEKMIKLTDITDEEIDTITKEIADAFYDYEYNKEDQGLIKFIPNRDSMYTYIGGIISAAYRT